MTDNQKLIKSAEPIVNELLSEWQLIPVEGRDDTACRILAKECGIEYLLCSKAAIHGVTVCVQEGHNDRTFVVSRDSITDNGGSLTPYYAMQICVEDGKIIGLGLAKTEDLIDFIDSGFAFESKSKNDEHVKYYACHWDDLRLAGYEVKEYSPELPKFDGKVAYNGTKMPYTCESCDIHDLYNICDELLSATGKKCNRYMSE